MKKHDVTADDIRSLNFPSSAKMSAEEFYDKATFSIKEMVSKTEIRTIHPKEKISYELGGSKTTSFNFIYGNKSLNSGEGVHTINNAEKYWTAVNYMKLGKCFTFIPPKWIKELEVLYCNLPEKV